MSILSKIFKSSQKVDDSSQGYSSNLDNYGYINDENSSNEDYSKDPDYEIVFWKELSNGTLIFQIIDDDADPAGHVIATSSNQIEILESGFYEYDDEDLSYIRNKAKEFCQKIGR